MKFDVQDCTSNSQAAIFQGLNNTSVDGPVQISIPSLCYPLIQVLLGLLLLIY